MKHLLVLFFTFLLISCGGESGESSESSSDQINRKQETTSPTNGETENSGEVPPSERVDLESKGIGPVESVTLSDEVDQALAQQGEKEYKQLCTACHLADRRFVGPSPQGILDRRTPEWIMNMILNPEEMVEKDPLAKDLFMEFNQSPMTNQNLTREQARAILEYFRTL